MTTTLPALPRPGARLYCDSYDVSPKHQAATVDTLLRCGAVGAIAMVEGITGERGSQLVDVDTVRRFVDLCGARDLDVTACAFPDVREPHGRSLDHMDACVSVGCEPELDAEPRAGKHWSPALVAVWRKRFPTMSLTTTRIEADDIGRVDCLVRGQLEQLTSIDTLEDAMKKLSLLTSRDLIQPVIGTFEQRGVIRTVAMVRRDLARIAQQAQRSGGFVAWSAHTTSHEEADAILETALGLWPAPRAA